jgi:hypothetical protein
MIRQRRYVSPVRPGDGPAARSEKRTAEQQPVEVDAEAVGDRPADLDLIPWSAA